MGENKNWTAVNYAVINGHYRTAKLLLDRGAHVEGGALLGDIQPTETPLQLAAASGSVRMVELLLASGASAFRSTTESQNGFSSAANYGGCYSAVAVAATHGHKKVLNLLVSHALTSSPEVSNSGTSGTDQVLSLEEILAEGASGGQSGSADDKASTTRLVKSQVNRWRRYFVLYNLNNFQFGFNILCKKKKSLFLVYFLGEKTSRSHVSCKRSYQS